MVLNVCHVFTGKGSEVLHRDRREQSDEGAKNRGSIFLIGIVIQNLKKTVCIIIN